LDGILANPGLVGGKFHNCPEGFGCRVINDNLVKAWDFEGRGMEVFNHGSGRMGGGARHPRGPDRPA
jgi:glycine betaine/proline transport system substrate-binding protein